MDRHWDHQLPGEVLGGQRHRTEVRGGRWRKLPPAADSNAGTDTGAQRDGNPDPGANSVGDAVDNTLAGAVADGNAKCDTDSDSGAKCGADPDTFGDSVAECGAVTKCDAKRNADAEGHAFDDGAGCFPDPNKGSGGRRAPRPAAAQAARWGAIGPYWGQ